MQDKKNDYADFRKFRNFYKEWLGRTEVDLPDHPWKQFMTQKDLENKDRDDMIKEILDYEPETWMTL